MERKPMEAIDLPIRLRNLPPALRTPSAGIATFAADTGADFRWSPIASAASESDGSLLVAVKVSTTSELVVAFATERAHARRGYLARTMCKPVADGRGGALEVVLQADVATVPFELPNGCERAGPIRVIRLDDPQWLPTHHTSTGLLLTAGAGQTMLLASGAYELQDALDPARRQTFQVPTSGPVVLNASLAPARADRP